jgi:hypothetical protein
MQLLDAYFDTQRAKLAAQKAEFAAKKAKAEREIVAAAPTPRAPPPVNCTFKLPLPIQVLESQPENAVL